MGELSPAASAAQSQFSQLQNHTYDCYLPGLHWGSKGNMSKNT